MLSVPAGGLRRPWLRCLGYIFQLPQSLGGKVDITWLGHACIRVRTHQTYLVMDPCDKTSGFDMGRPTADIVTISNQDPFHNHVRGIRGEPLTIQGPGEYEAGGVQITGVSTFLRPPNEEMELERNTTFIVESEELRLVHVGGIGSSLTADQVEQLSGTNVLVVPIGATPGITTEEAILMVRALEPSLVIPVSYPVNGAGEGGKEALHKFVTGMGLESPEPVTRASINRRGLSDTPQLLLLTPRS